MPKKKVVIFGATGHLGRQVAEALVGRGAEVTAFVRESSRTAALEELGVAIVRGDITSAMAVSAAMRGCDAVVATVASFGTKQARAALSSDEVLYQALVLAASVEKVPRFILCSVLDAHKATVDVFRQKFGVEEMLRRADVPFVALRPAAFIDQAHANDWLSDGLRKGSIFAQGPRGTEYSMVLSSDVARCFAIAATDDRLPADGRHIDLGCTEPISWEKLGQLSGASVTHMPGFALWPALWLGSWVRPDVAHFREMMLWWSQDGNYVADTAEQEKWFGPVPTNEGMVRAYMASLGLSAA